MTKVILSAAAALLIVALPLSAAERPVTQEGSSQVLSQSDCNTQWAACADKACRDALAAKGCKAPADQQKM